MIRTFSTLVAAALLLSCVINNGDDGGGPADDGTDDGTPGDGSDPDDGTAGDGASADDGPADDNGDGASADETAGGPSGDGPAPGAWLYHETGAAQSDCTFLDDPSNGFGEFMIVSDSPGAFTIIPGDGTDPFACTHDGATYDCAERLQDEISQQGTSLQVLVAVVGDLISDSELDGTQQGRIVCEGDCATAEALLGTSFPCEFSVPFQATKL